MAVASKPTKQQERARVNTSKNHLGAWDVGLGVEQVLEQVLLGPAVTPRENGNSVGGGEERGRRQQLC